MPDHQRFENRLGGLRSDRSGAVGGASVSRRPQLGRKSRLPEGPVGLRSPSVDSFAGISCVACFADIANGASVLDLGCGSGMDSLLVGARAASVLGVDFSKQMLDRARRSAEAMGLSNVEFRDGDAERIPAETGSIDVAFGQRYLQSEPGTGGHFRRAGQGGPSWRLCLRCRASPHRTHTT